MPVQDSQIAIDWRAEANGYRLVDQYMTLRLAVCC